MKENKLTEEEEEQELYLSIQKEIEEADRRRKAFRENQTDYTSIGKIILFIIFMVVLLQILEHLWTELIREII